MLNYFTFQKQIIRFRIEIGNNTVMDCISNDLLPTLLPGPRNVRIGRNAYKKG